MAPTAGILNVQADTADDETSRRRELADAKATLETADGCTSRFLKGKTMNSMLDSAPRRRPLAPGAELAKVNWLIALE